MRGINRVTISGNVSGQTQFNKTGSGVEACSFKIASDRRTSQGQTITAWVKINVYGDGFVNVCRQRLEKGVYVLVEGELMNRDGQLGELLEVRAKDVLFFDAKRPEQPGT